MNPREGTGDGAVDSFDQPQVMVVGHICLDLIPNMTSMRSGFQHFMPGLLLEVGGVELSAGGAVANTGLAIHRLGVSVRLIGKVGDDVFGAHVRAILNQHIRFQVASQGPVGSENHLIVDPHEDTSYTVVLSPGQDDRLLLHCPGSNDTLRASDIPDSAFRGIRLLHFGYPPLMRQFYTNDGRELVMLFQRAKQYGVVTSLDMAVPDPNRPSGHVDWISLLGNTLPFVDLFLPSVEEALFMLDRDRFNEIREMTGTFVHNVQPVDLRNVAERALAMGAKVVALKLGDQGLYVRTSPKLDRSEPGWMQQLWAEGDWRSREVYAPCYSTNVVGTTGAGDCTIAGFLCGLLRGLSLDRTVTIALGVGACNVECMDAISGIPRREEIERRIDAGWAQLSSILPTASWPSRHTVLLGPNDRYSGIVS